MLFLSFPFQEMNFDISNDGKFYKPGLKKYVRPLVFTSKIPGRASSIFAPF